MDLDAIAIIDVDILALGSSKEGFIVKELYIPGSLLDLHMHAIAV